MNRAHYSIIEQPALEPIGFHDAAAHLRIDSEEDAGEIQRLIAVAREHVEGITGRSTIATGYLLVSPSWAHLGVGVLGGYAFPIYRVPLMEVTAIRYFPPGDPEAITLDEGDYRICTTTTPGTIQLLIDPPETDQRPDAIQIEFRAGYETPEEVPAGMRHAIRMMVADLYEERKSESPMRMNPVNAAASLLANQRVKGWFG